MQKKINTIWVSFSSCLGDIDVVEAIIFHRGTEIPTFYSMGFPHPSHCRLFIYDDLCARRGERRGVLVELSMQLCIPGKFWVHARLLEQVEHENGLWCKLAPEMKREVLVSTVKYCYEVLLEGPDCSFCWFCPMNVRWDYLKLFIQLPHKLF